MPFEAVVERLRPERDVRHDPMFQLVFSLNNNRQERERSGRAERGTAGNESAPAKVDIEVEVVERRERIGGTVCLHGESCLKAKQD